MSHSYFIHLVSCHIAHYEGMTLVGGIVVLYFSARAVDLRNVRQAAKNECILQSADFDFIKYLHCTG